MRCASIEYHVAAMTICLLSLFANVGICRSGGRARWAYGLLVLGLAAAILANAWSIVGHLVEGSH